MNWPLSAAAMALLATLGCRWVPPESGGRKLPEVVVTHDDTVITQSCWLVIAPGLVIADANSNGVVQIAADRIDVRFKPGSVLRGAPAGAPWDQLGGTGIRIEGHSGVGIRGAVVHGFRTGIVAKQADGLVVEDADLSDNYRQHLRSTPAAEDGGDWLFPHHNDERKWRDEYGGALCIESADGVTVRNVRVRRGQNGIVLDRVNRSRIYDNDCSFLSGWGLALWRSSSNIVSRNAFDFCVRGHVEGVYNRGQDSAGILCFEQCNANVLAENSATHGGDGFFGFAGHEAIGEHWMARERARLRRELGREDVDATIRPESSLVRTMSDLGCNRNLLVGNDFSYAAAHGIEMTFSEDNAYVDNRVVENAICGFWGGYSSRSLISGNEFSGNGGMAYGLERGAINMEHAADNRVEGNRFIDNKCAIHLWWDNDGALLKYPGVAGNERGVSGNIIAGNRFEVTPNPPFARLGAREKLIVFQFRDPSSNHFSNNLIVSNTIALRHPQSVEALYEPGCQPGISGRVPPVARVTRPEILGRQRPVGARTSLRGREKILMDEWGPWDHEGVFMRQAPARRGAHVIEVFGDGGAPVVDVLAGKVRTRMEAGTPTRLVVESVDGVSSYRLRVRSGEVSREFSGTIMTANWEAVFFPWTTDDPRKDVEAWRRLALGAGAVKAVLGNMDLPYGMGGPRDLRLSDEVTQRGPGSERFGMIARARLKIPAGRWRVTTLSDDGVRVTIDRKVVIENWTWHGPTENDGVYVQATDGEVDAEVEHFEIDGYSVLKLEIRPDLP